jgi:hypothetical protein
MEADLVIIAQQRGWQHGTVAAPFSPPVRWCLCEDADDAYRIAYFAGLAYGRPGIAYEGDG